MKKMVCIFLVVTMLFSLSCAAMAASFSTVSLNQGVGANAGSAKKTTGTGSAASGSATYASSSRAIFQATVRKPDGVNASETRQFTGAGSFTLPTRMDGYGNALLRNGYDYVLRIAHRSNSPVSTASVSGTGIRNTRTGQDKPSCSVLHRKGGAIS